MPNPFVHVELNTDDVAAAKRFYRGLFKWKLSDVKMHGGSYTMLDVGKGTGGGMQKKPMPEAPTSWLPYVEVDDVAKTLAKAQKLGAKVVVPSTDIGMGTLGIFIDPAGASLGVWATAKRRPARKPAKRRR